jgi:NitT/TauT family transport system ATP-binding protein
VGEGPALNGSAPAVSCVGVRKVWNAASPRAHEALTNISLEIDSGEFVVLLGPSGCGKSTLLYLIAGLEQQTSGTISAHGVPVTGPAPQRSLIFQDTSLFPWLNVWQNVSFGLSLRGVPVEQRKETARQVLARVGLSYAFEKRPDELSGGMRQRVAVARALAMKPQVLLMDEPFAALDVQTRFKMHGFLLEVRDVSKASILLVTHDIDEAIALADRVLVSTARPGRIKGIVRIDLPRPRALTSPPLLALRAEIASLLRDEVDRAFAEDDSIFSTG